MVSLATINENLRVRNPSSRKAQGGLPSLRRGAVSVEGQSLRGLAADTLRRNGVRTAWRVLKDVGAPARNRPLLSEHPGVSAERLAAVMQVDEGLVRSRMYPPIAKGERSFFGLPVPHTGIENRERRFAPAFLKNNRHHLAAWELRLLPFCPITWEILVSQCPCRPGKVTTQGWTRTGSYPDQCDECGRPLCRIRTDKVEAKSRVRLELITRLVVDVTHGREGWRECLPDNLSGVEAADLFRVLHALADNIRVSENINSSLNNDPAITYDCPHIGDAIGRLAEACTMLIGWPYAIEGASFILAEDSALLVKLQKDYCALGVVRKGQGLVNGKKSDEINRLFLNGGIAVGIREASAMARLSVNALKAIWTAGLVTRYVRPHGGRVLPAFDTLELEVIGAQWNERLDLGSVSYRLGISRYGLEQLTDKHIVPANALTAVGFEAAYLEQDIARFEADITGSAENGIVNGESISQTLRRVSGRAKPWLELVEAMLGGTVRYGIRKGNAPIFDRVMLSEDFDIGALPLRSNNDGDENQSSGSLCQTDALEILNCSASSLSILKNLASEGKNPRFFNRGSILDLAAKVVATAEVAEHLHVHPARVACIMRSANIHEEVRGGWPRERTMRFVKHVRELQAAQMEIALEG